MLVAMRDWGRLQRKMFKHDITGGRLGVALPGPFFRVLAVPPD